MKTTPELLKARRKQRRAESRSKANQAFLAMSEVIVLNICYMDEGEYGMPSLKEEPTSKLASLLRLGRKLTPMLDCAGRELDRRYRDETKRRRRELKKDYKAMVLRQLADKAKAEVEKV